MEKSGFIFDVQYEEVEANWWQPEFKLQPSLIITGIWWLAIATKFLA